MNTQNVSFQSLRLLCSQAKARLFPAAFLFCLLASPGMAQALPDVPNPLPIKGSLVADENYREYASSNPSGEILAPITRLLFVVTADGTANTGRLGQMRVIYVGMVDYLGGTGQQCARFIAANGDSIFTTSTGQASQTQNPGVRSIMEFHTVTGGTGDFAQRERKPHRQPIAQGLRRRTHGPQRGDRQRVSSFHLLVDGTGRCGEHSPGGPTRCLTVLEIVRHRCFYPQRRVSRDDRASRSKRNRSHPNRFNVMTTCV